MLSWWPKLASLTKLYGPQEAVSIGRSSEEAISEIGNFCAQHAIDADFRDQFRESGQTVPSAIPRSVGQPFQGEPASPTTSSRPYTVSLEKYDIDPAARQMIGGADSCQASADDRNVWMFRYRRGGWVERKAAPRHRAPPPRTLCHRNSLAIQSAVAQRR